MQNLRVNNVEIPNSKKVEISLQYIYGIGSTTAKAILRDTVSAGSQRAAGAFSLPCSSTAAAAEAALNERTTV